MPFELERENERLPHDADGHRAATSASTPPRSFADVDDSSADSFPASDPPSWSSMRVGAPYVRASGVDESRSR